MAFSDEMRRRALVLVLEEGLSYRQAACRLALECDHAPTRSTVAKWVFHVRGRVASKVRVFSEEQIEFVGRLWCSGSAR